MNSGLSSEQARQGLAEHGHNELAPPRPPRLHRLAAEILHEPMFLLLLAAGFIYLLLGETSDALMLLGFVLVIIAMTLLQAQKSARVLESLSELSSPRARVMRDGKAQRIAGREVVPGDLLLLEEGDRVAADAVLLDCNDLFADESMLTGESVAVRKQVGDPNAAAQEPGGENQPFVYAGTVLVQGSGIARVTATGRASAIGRIGLSLQHTASGISPLRRQIARLVSQLSLIAVSLCLCLVLLFGMTRGHWLDALLAGISLAMSTLPEELPVILSIFMSLGAWRIAQHGVLTRQLNAIETLGAATVLCSDKTGTLTENRMVIRQLYGNGQRLEIHDPAELSDLPNLADLPEPWHELVEFGILASEKAPFDPMERALHELGQRTLSGSEHLHDDWQLVHEYSLSADLPAMSHVWLGDDPVHHLVAAKGAPEAIIDLCHLSARETAEFEQQAAEMAASGLRVLGVARAKLPIKSDNWPSIQHDIEFSFIGLIGLQDPLRRDVQQAIRQCAEAGIRVVMITGDHPATATAIAKELGLPAAHSLTGSELNRLDAAELRARIRETQVFARITPQQKLRLVEAFKANDEIVAMTGDGVNDAPALKSAHIGVAMGQRGTDVAREAAALVLLHDDFASLVTTIRLGRRIYDNLRRAMSYTLAVHLPIVGMAILPVLLGQPLLLMPAHIMFLELIIGPACSIFFEAEGEAPDLMHRPPRAAHEALFDGPRLKSSLLQGGLALAFSTTIYAAALSSACDENLTRTLVFVSMVGSNLVLLLANRNAAATRNPTLKWILLGTLAALLLILSVPALRALFHFGLFATTH